MAKKVSITHPEKVLFPDCKLTKKELIEYYRSVFSYMKPFLKDRPVTLERYTEGIDKEGFFQQNIPDYYPEWISKIDVERKNKKEQQMVEIRSKSSLDYIINQDTIAIHRWLSCKKNLQNPDMLLFDLDPPSEDLKEVVQIAKEIKKRVEKCGASLFVMTTGSKGLHLIIPIKADTSFEKVRDIAKQLAKTCAENLSDIATCEIRKNKRGKKVFIDYMRNSYGQTAICPYSVRATASASIATPLHWHEVTTKLNAQKYHIQNIHKRLSKTDDPFKDLNKNRVSIKTLA